MGRAHKLEPCGRQGIRCVVCGAMTEGLLTWCPGFRLNEGDMASVVGGKVVDLERYRSARSWGHSKTYVREEAAEEALEARNLDPDEAMDAFMKYMDDTSIEDANASLGGDDL